jgi:hypothetical protein
VSCNRYFLSTLCGTCCGYSGTFAVLWYLAAATKAQIFSKSQFLVAETLNVKDFVFMAYKIKGSYDQKAVGYKARQSGILGFKSARVSTYT